jgi:hypothetical protein
MLFCKPSPKSGVLYERSLNQAGCLKFRSLVIKKDLKILHHWVNEPIEQLRSIYQFILKNPNGHSFIGLLNEELICQIDLYRIQTSDLGKHFSSQLNDCCVRLLMAPQVSMLNQKVMETFLCFYFSYHDADRLYSEPDIHDHKACRLLEQSGFLFSRNVMLPDKAASIYFITRKQFYTTHSAG